jgi:plasmid stabilization system protein ParE
VRLAHFLKDAPPDIAEQLAVALYKRMHLLSRFPMVGRPFRGGPLRETIVPFGKSRYVIRYKVTDHTIQIIRIWHGKEDRPR